MYLVRKHRFYEGYFDLLKVNELNQRSVIFDHESMIKTMLPLINKISETNIFEICEKL